VKLTLSETAELQQRYSYLTNYDEVRDPDSPIDLLTYVDSNGDSLLHIAVQGNDLRSVELLLRAEAPVNRLGDLGNTPLHYASSKEMVDLLTGAGAATDVKNEFGKLPLDR
jgi:ankyrin repeat protein